MNPSHHRQAKRASNSSNPTNGTTDSSGDIKKGSSRKLIDYTKQRGEGRQYCQRPDEEKSATLYCRRLSPDLPAEITIFLRSKQVQDKSGVVAQANADDGLSKEIGAIDNDNAL